MSSELSYPVLVLCGRDEKRRELMQVLDPEREYPSKALLPMLGRRVLDWQLDALSASPSIGEIFLIGLTAADFPPAHQVSFIPIPTTTTILEKIMYGAEAIRKKYPGQEHLIISTGDAPAMTVTSVEKFFDVQ